MLYSYYIKLPRNGTGTGTGSGSGFQQSGEGRSGYDPSC